MKKERFVVYSLLITLLISMTLISAAETNAEAFLRTTADTITELLETWKINPDNLTTILLGLLLWMVLFTVTKQMKIMGGEAFSAIAALAMTILAFVTMPEGMLETFATQFGVTGATILTVIPFLVVSYFTFMVAKNLLMARIIWVVYIFYYLLIFLWKIGTATYVSGTEVFQNPENWFYISAVILGIIIFFFLKEIRELFLKGEISARKEVAYQRLRKRSLGREVLEAEAENLS